MDLERLEARLARAFRARPQVLGEAQIVWRRRPIPLWQWVEELMEEADWDEVGEGCLEDWPGSIQAVLDGHLRDLLFFYWDGLGPTSSVAGLQVLELGGRGYLVYWNELESYQAVGVLEPWRDDLVVSAAVKEITVDVDRDVLARILGLEMQQLGHDQVGDLIVDRRAQEDDPLAQQVRVQVGGPLPARVLLDNHRHQRAHPQPGLHISLSDRKTLTRPAACRTARGPASRWAGRQPVTGLQGRAAPDHATTGVSRIENRCRPGYGQAPALASSFSPCIPEGGAG